MNGPRTLALAAALAMLPFALAHQDGVSGIPKTYCEETLLDRQVHDYAGQYLGHPLLTLDASAPGSCPYDPEWDHHYEFSVGGNYLTACDSACGLQYSGGSLACFGTSADHATYPTVWVRDLVFPSGVRFTVGADTVQDVIGHDDPYCGDFELNDFIACVDVCTVPFPPGFDGSYAVVVEGTAGHVQTVDPATYPPAWP